MKTIKFAIVFTLILLLYACVPSLHGIVQEGEELIDDQIVNQWIAGHSGGNMNIKITVDDEEGQKRTFSSFEEMGAYFKGDTLPKSGSSWLIERAGNITFERREDNNDSSVTLDVGTPSMAPEGYVVTRFDAHPYYLLTHIDWDNKDKITSYLTIKLTEIGGNKYMDFAPFPKGIDFWEGRFATNLIAGHTFARYKVSAEGLMIEPLDGEHIENLIEKKRVRLKHEIVDGNTILTASTEELRAFIEKYQGDSQLFNDEEMLTAIYE